MFDAPYFFVSKLPLNGPVTKKKTPNMEGVTVLKLQKNDSLNSTRTTS